MDPMKERHTITAATTTSDVTPAVTTTTTLQPSPPPPRYQLLPSHHDHFAITAPPLVPPPVCYIYLHHHLSPSPPQSPLSSLLTNTVAPKGRMWRPRSLVEKPTFGCINQSHGMELSASPTGSGEKRFYCHQTPSASSLSSEPEVQPSQVHVKGRQQRLLR